MKFRKKPVIIEAWRWTGTIADIGIPDWVVAAVNKWPSEGGIVLVRDAKHVASNCLKISTKEGYMRADVGDWIIRGVAGELYSCKPDIFAMTYEAVQ